MATDLQIILDDAADDLILDGKGVHTPIITANKSGSVTTIYVDGSPIATINDGEDGSAPVITASKSNGVTTIYANGTEIATINDGNPGVYIGTEAPSDPSVTVWIDSDGTPDTANNIIADEYSTSSTYFVGDYCVHEGDLYRCNTDISTAEVWTASHWTQVTIGGEFTDLREDLDTKAEADGTYETLTAGQILSDNYTEDSTPYLLRPTGGSASQEYNEVVGGTVCWNQLVPVADTETTNQGITFTGDGNGGITINGTSTGAAFRNITAVANGTFAVLKNHVYLTMSGHESLRITGYGTVDGSTVNLTNDFYGIGINKPTFSSEPTRSWWRIVMDSGVTFDNEKVYPHIHDLTQMFGSTIADYIYSLEQATAGSGIQWLKSHGFFTKDYYPYNAGTLMSVKTSGHKTVGFNLWDEIWELGNISQNTGANAASNDRIRSVNYISVLPDTTYRYKSENTLGVRYYDANKQFITYTTVSSGNKITPSNCYFIRIVITATTTYGNNVCISLPSDRNGEYEPYQEHLYPLSDIELRGIPKLDSGNNLYYDGDTYESDGTVTRKYGVVDMGTLTWAKSSATYSIFRCFPPNMASVTEPPYINRLMGAICSAYPVSTEYQIGDLTSDKAWIRSLNGFYIRDSAYSDATDFKAAMSGVMLIYELAESTTETTDPFTSPQFCDEYGTEEYIDTRDVPIPVGHNTRYPENLKKKIEGLPWSAVSDVQVNGTSVVTDGVADIPVASTDDLGVVKVNTSGTGGLVVDSGNTLKVSAAGASHVKAGTNGVKPVTPDRQHESVFYGLAKASGDTTQSASSNAVGAYTDDAKIKIQKMLGIYEAPWELIRYDTGTNATEADIDITVDGNGNAFELTDVRMLFWMPTQDTTPSKADYGRIFFYYGALSADVTYCGTISQGNRIIGAEIEQKGNMVKVTEIRSGTISAELIPYNTVRAYPYSNNDSQIWSLLSGQRIYSRIVATKVTGTYGYVIYGKRKWS